MIMDKENKRCLLGKSKLLLHTSMLPDKLLHRDNECKAIREFINNGISKPRTSRVLSISGVPGTGKTVSVLKIVKDLKEKPRAKKFKFVNINALELSDPKSLFQIVYQAVNKGLTGARKKISTRDAHELLNVYFNNEANKKQEPVVILIDEVDMLYTKREDVVYTLFNWTASEKSKCCVIVISNTLDLAERKFSQRVVSRMGSNKLTFQPYEFHEIEAILTNRLRDCEGINEKTIELASKKIASVSGDLRRALELLRRSIDLALEQNDLEGKCSSKKQVIGIEHVLEAIKESTNSIRLEFIQSLPRHEEFIFRSLISDLSETALEDSNFSRIFHIYKKLCTSEGLQPLSLSAAFHHLQELANSHLIVLSTENGQLHCKAKLGFSLSEAQFCIRQVDASRQKMEATTDYIGSTTKSPRNSRRSTPASSPSSHRSLSKRRITRTIDFG